MALKALKGVKKLGEFNVVVMDELREKFPEKFNESGSMDYKWFEKDIRPNNFVYFHNNVNSITFTLQKGKVEEVGLNGCSVDTLILAAKEIIERGNKENPSKAECMASIMLEEALMWLESGRNDRIKEETPSYKK